jgi:hypothetical protein
MSPLPYAYSPAPLIAELGNFAFAADHHAESPVNSNVPSRSRTSASGGLNIAAIIRSVATSMSLVASSGSASRTRRSFVFRSRNSISF